MDKKPLKHTHPPRTSEKTLAALIRQLEPTWSWSKCRGMITAGRVLVDEIICTDAAKRFPLSVTVKFASQRSKQLQKHSNLYVYFFDSQLIVVEKPSGIDSVPFTTKNQEDAKKNHNKQETTLIDLARIWLEQEEKKKLPPLRTVHRIDKGTSGIVVFARTQSAERALNQQFRDHSIDRHYLAIVTGKPANQTIRTVLVDDRGDGYRGSRATSGPQKLKDGKTATTHVKLLETATHYSLIECRLETGRTHQIRIHLSEQGHPLCGDAVYRKPKPHGPAIPDADGATRLMLHAAELGFIHPATEEHLKFTSPVPPEFDAFWRKIRQ